LSRRRSLLILAGKVAVAGLLVGWLLRSGALDLAALGLLFERPALLAGTLGVFSLAVGIGALRWRLLLELADVRLSVGRALQLQLTGFFFNVVIPGNIGGEIVKSVYAARQATPDKRPTVFLIAFVDRLLGIAGLIAVALVMTLLRGRAAWDAPQLRELSGVVVVLAALTFGVPLVLLVIIRRSGDRLAGWPGGTTRLARVLGQLAGAVRLVAAGPRLLVVALCLSIVVHVAAMALFAALATAITSQDVSLVSLASVFPLGMLTVVLPISPAGVGVGHVAFDRLFAIVGLSGGATVFNVYLIGQIAPCLVGLIPYLALRRAAALPTEAEAQMALSSR
jgi:glycosyltransferase 2 family protein